MKNYFTNLLRISICVLCICILGIVNVEAFYTLGDVERDGRVNASDALLVLKKAAGLRELDDYQQMVADVNSDGVIDAEDALQILTVAAKIDAFRISVELAEGQVYVIDKIYDVDPYWWIWKVSNRDGIHVEKENMELPADAAPGDTPEQVFTITAEKTGTYEFSLRKCYLGDEANEIVEERVYVINVKGKEK